MCVRCVLAGACIGDVWQCEKGLKVEKHLEHEGGKVRPRI